MPKLEKIQNCISKTNSLDPTIEHVFESGETDVKNIRFSNQNQSDDNFIDNFLSLEVLKRIFDSIQASFVSQVFPQFFIKTLTKFNKLFDCDDERNFNKEVDSFGDHNNPSIRDQIYTSQCELLYSILTTRIQNKPSLIKELIDALRIENWYLKLADSFETELNNWRKNEIMNFSKNHNFLSSGSTSSLDFIESANADSQIPLNQNIKNFSYSKMLIGTKSRSLLYNIPEPISYFVDRNKKSDELLSSLRNMTKQGAFKSFLYSL